MFNELLYQCQAILTMTQSDNLHSKKRSVGKTTVLVGKVQEQEHHVKIHMGENGAAPDSPRLA